MRGSFADLLHQVARATAPAFLLTRGIRAILPDFDRERSLRQEAEGQLVVDGQTLGAGTVRDVRHSHADDAIACVFLLAAPPCSRPALPAAIDV